MLAEPLDPTKYHVLDKKKKAYLIMLILFLVLIALPVFGLFYYKFAVRRPSQTDREVKLEIQGGQGVSEIANLLYQNDVINSAFLFKVYVVINGLQDNIQAGVYTIPAGVSVDQLANMLQKGTADIKITYVEGLRAEEYAKITSTAFNKVDYEGFVRLAKPYEGYLFPDTYMFRADAGEQEIIDILRTTFVEKTTAILTDQALAQAGLTRDQAVILASIVEREVSNSDDRPIVAGILINRFREGSKLDADATTQYAVAPLRYGCPSVQDFTSEDVDICPDEQYSNVTWWPQDLTLNDLDFDSPYNTRKNVGLPPTPICNPSLDAIEAVLNYEETDYFYYLTDSDGVTHYAKTLEEHNENVERYL